MNGPEKCRSCGKKLPGKAKEGNPWYPFCSERCRMVDLGQWFDQEYRLAEPGGPVEDPNVDKSEGK